MPQSLTTKYIFEEADGTRRAVPRFLTKRECAALMGFPPTFVLPEPRRATREAGVFGEHEIYRQLGNAVCPPVIEAIGRCLLPAAGLPTLGSPTPSEAGAVSNNSKEAERTETALKMAPKTAPEVASVPALMTVSVPASDPASEAAADEALLTTVIEDGQLSLPGCAPVPRRLRGSPLHLPTDLGEVERALLVSAQLLSIPAALLTSGLARLELLDVSYNAIKALPEQPEAWSSLPALLELNASHNLLKILPPALSCAATLRRLNLRSNQLRGWHDQCAAALEGLQNLETLDLRYNPRLRSLDEGTLRQTMPAAVLGPHGSPAVLLGAEEGEASRLDLDLISISISYTVYVWT